MARTTFCLCLLVCFTSIHAIATPCWCKIKKTQSSPGKEVYQATVVADAFKHEYLFDVSRDTDHAFIRFQHQDQIFTLDLSNHRLYTDDSNELSDGQASTATDAIELIIAEYLLADTCSRLQKVDQEVYPAEVPLVPGDFYQ